MTSARQRRRGVTLLRSATALRAWERGRLSWLQRLLCDRDVHRWHRHAPWPPPPGLAFDVLTPSDTAHWREVRGG